MWKTFFVSPFAGGIAAILGWIGAVLFRDSMSEAEFATLRFGWAGVMIGGVALGAILVLVVASDMIDPMVMVASAGFGSYLLWNQLELPFATDNLETEGTPYWFAFTMMAVVFLLLLMGLKAARETSTRAR